MICQQCICFLQDFLEFPCKSSQSSSEKIFILKRTLANEIYRILTTINNHHNMVKRVKREYLNLVEKKIHIPAKPLELHLFDVALNYYTYFNGSNIKRKEFDQTVQMICIELVEHGVLKCNRSLDPLLSAKLWFLEKYFYCLEHLKDIHDEHSGKKSNDSDTLIFKQSERISDEEIKTWDELYN